MSAAPRCERCNVPLVNQSTRRCDLCKGAACTHDASAIDRRFAELRGEWDELLKQRDSARDEIAWLRTLPLMELNEARAESARLRAALTDALTLMEQVPCHRVSISRPRDSCRWCSCRDAARAALAVKP